jgi:hypothetical protein
MEDGTNFCVFRVASTVVSIHTTLSPTDQQWDEYLDAIKKVLADFGFIKASAISFTDGGAPTSAQRERFNLFLGGRSARTSVVSGSSVVRAVVTALGWFNQQIKTYPPNRVHDALVHIGFAPSDVPKLCARLRPMAGSVEAVRKALEDLDAATGRDRS